MSKKSGCGGLFRQKLKKCLRPGAQTPRPPGTGGKRQPCGLLPPKAAKRPEGAPKGSASPVGCCHRRWQSLYVYLLNTRAARGQRAERRYLRGSKTSGGRGQRPPRRLSDREKPGDTNSLWGGRREASAQWAVATEGGKATRRSQPKRATDAASGRRDD